MLHREQIANVSIVILNYNTRDLLALCLESIQRFAAGSQVIVVDNASADDSVITVRQHFPWVKLIANETNIGFARGMNLGLRTSSTPVVLTLNADTELLPNTLLSLIEALNQLPRAGILGPVQYLPVDGWSTQRRLASAFPDPTLAREAWRLLFFGDALASRFGWGPWENTIGAPQRVDWLIGSAMLFRRECLDSIHGFDESQFMYGEDWDLCYRARQMGWIVYLVPESKIIHHENASARSAFGYQRAARVLQAHLYFHRKHFGRASSRLLSFLYLIGVGFRLPLGSLWSHPSANRWQEQLEVARLAWRGIWAT